MLRLLQFLDKLGIRRPIFTDTGNAMRRALPYRLVAVLVIISVGALAYVAVAHGHRTAKSNEEGHCRICLAAHSGTHGVTSPAAQLYFVPLVTRSAVAIPQATFVSIESHPTQGRAPPDRLSTQA